ncbi:MAG TPA: molybdopterin biosynthesis protein [Candidatus Tectomicrobia bacterium]|nr:molybdopterin biosynthesis protein [Candidatus Tectomicrobia bacterium]
MKQEQFLHVLTKEEAEAIFHQHIAIAPLGEEGMPLEHCLGRVLSRDIVAAVDVPFFNRSNVDGFAVVAADTFGVDEESPAALSLTPEHLSPGVVPGQEVQAGVATIIATGAIIPKGANAVVMVEDTDCRDGMLYVYRPVVPGENISYAGQDIMQGETILREGQALSSRETGVLAALGCAEVWCYRRPRVAVISTGDELIPPGQPMAEGKVYDSNARIVADAVRENGGEPVILGICPDDEAALEDTLRRALAHDLIILSGGTSKGAGDLSYRVIERLGPPGILVHGVALRPGKPLCLGAVGRTPVVILPGFPTSATVTFHEFVQPLVRAMAGLNPAERHTIPGRAAVRFNSHKGQLEYVLVHIVRGKEGYTAYPIGKGSGSMTTFSQADGFIKIPTNQEMLAKDEIAAVHLLSRDLRLADVTVIGSHCVGLDYLVNGLKHEGIQGKIINVGSTAGLQAARRGEADIAGIHLLDEPTGAYNRPFLRSGDGLALVRGYVRRQGLIYRAGNELPQPLTFERLVEVAAKEGKLVLINRNRGSGTRILFDRCLHSCARWLGITFDKLTESLRGYDTEAKSHNAVAASIALGKADWGLAIDTVAHDYQLAFSFMQDEHYDFVIPTDKLSQPAIQRFLELLRSDTARAGLTRVGFQVPPDIGTVTVVA